MKSILFSTLLLSPIILADAGDIVVTAEGFERNYLESTSAIYVIDQSEIESMNATSVADLLKRKGGFSVQTNGAFGKASSINLRGTDNRHTLVLIDGVRVTDITSISGGTRLEFLDPAQIEKIEILKGNQGVLYGSEAVGGVISITTKKGAGSQVALEYGSYDKKKVSAHNSFSKGDNRVSVTGSFQDVDGISAYNEDRISGNIENDGFKQSDLLINWQNRSIDKLILDFQGEFKNSSYLYDDSSADNPNLNGEYKTARYALSSTYNHSKLVNLDFTYSHFNVDRKLFGENSYGKFTYLYQGNFNRYTLVNRSFYSEGGELVTGIEYEREKTKALDSLLNQTRSKERMGAYINNYNKFGGLILEEGIRYEDLQFFGDKFVYRLGAGYNFNNLTVKVSQGTSFKAPTLYQSFAQFGGNRNLEMESSTSRELSLLYKNKNYMNEVTYFEIDYDKYIDYDTTRSIYNNSGDYESYGVEWNQQYTSERFDIGLFYTFLRSKNKITGATLPRRSKHNLGFNAEFRLDDHWSFLTDSQFRGKRTDSNGKKLTSYYLTNLGVQYNWNKSSDRISLSLNNIFNKSYEEVWGYGTPGRNFLISYRFRI